MCGIAGVMTLNNVTLTEDFIRDAMVAGMLRGYDSAGIFQQDKAGKIWFHKEASEGVYVAFSKKGQAYIKDVPKCPVTITHTRAATQGDVNDRNAHPFVLHKPNKRPLVGCHNGSLTTAWKHKPDGKDYEVDSEWALAQIAAKGNDAFKEIYGAYCFVWMEEDKPGKVFMCRNSQRPMHLLWSEDEKQCFFASEAGMLAWLCERNKIRTKSEIMVLGTDKIYEFDVTGEKVTFTSTPVPRAYTAPATNVSVIGTAPEKKVGDLNPDGVRFVDKIKKAAQGKLEMYGRPSVYSPYVFDAEKIKDTLDIQDDAERRRKEREKQIEAAFADLVDDNKGDVITQQRDDDAPFSEEGDEGFALEEDTDLVPAKWFSTRGVKNEERVAARAQGFYRELQWVEGVCWDESTGSLMGDVEIWDKKNGKQVYTGIIRDISQARAHAEFIDNGSRAANIRPGAWVVISGMYSDKMLGQVFVLAELNQEGKQAMRDQRNKAN